VEKSCLKYILILLPIWCFGQVPDTIKLSHSGFDFSGNNTIDFTVTDLDCGEYELDVEGDKDTLIGERSIYLEDFGGKGDNSTDNLQPFLDAIAYSESVLNGAEIKLKGGKYRVSGTISEALDNRLKISGEGKQITEIIMIGTGDLFNFTTNRIDISVHFEHLTIGALNACGAAIKLDVFDVASWSLENFTAEDIEITSLGAISTNHFDYGIWLIDAWNASIHDVFVRGSGNNIVNMKAGIKIDGNSIDAQMNDVSVFFADTAIAVLSESEGAGIVGARLVFNDHGLVVDLTGGMAPSDPLVFVTDVHTNNFTSGIELIGVLQFKISGLLLYKNPNQIGPYTDILIEGCLDGVISDGTLMFNANPDPGDIGVNQIGGSDRIMLHHLNIKERETGIEQSGAGQVDVDHIRYTGVTTNTVGNVINW